MTDPPLPVSDRGNDFPSQAVDQFIPAWIHGLAWGGVLFLILLLVGVSCAFQGQNVWEGWVESSNLRRPSYAEVIHIRELFRTQANTWSNLAYVLIGLYAIGFGWHDLWTESSSRRNYLTQTPAMSHLFGASCVCLGLGSGLFHASLTRWGQQLDVTSMYAPLLSFIAINLGRRWPVIFGRDHRVALQTWPFLVGFVCVASAYLYHYKWSMSSAYVLSTLIVLVGLFGVIDRFSKVSSLNTAWLIAANVTLVVGVVCRQLDVAGRFSSPDAWYQGHAFWHVFTGLSLGCQYLYYRSERLLRIPEATANYL
ncbi:MAG: hypothetical protein DWH81_01890 [Planctomycetota bacterium]|nr:MAG: hypothetical protein DWH81_01890 [Planctomycetota bacterium]